jgi:hypothetical protein
MYRCRTFYCGQHNCTSCSRTTQEAGGLLFRCVHVPTLVWRILSFTHIIPLAYTIRCQVCDVSLCEDCLGTEEIEAIGDVLPEFLVLQYGRRAQAYYMCVFLSYHLLRPYCSLTLIHCVLDIQSMLQLCG